MYLIPPKLEKTVEEKFIDEAFPVTEHYLSTEFSAPNASFCVTNMCVLHIDCFVKEQEGSFVDYTVKNISYRLANNTWEQVDASLWVEIVEYLQTNRVLENTMQGKKILAN